MLWFRVCCVCQERPIEDTALVDEEEGPEQPRPLTSESASEATEQRDPETRQRLQSAMKRFLESAASGRPCTIFDVTQPKRFSGQFRIDRKLEEFTLHRDGCPDEIDRFILEELQECYTWREMSRVPKLQTFIRLKNLKVLSKAEKESTVIAEFAAEGSREVRRVCLLVKGGSEAAGEFVELMRVVRVFKQQQLQAEQRQKLELEGAS